MPKARIYLQRRVLVFTVCLVAIVVFLYLLGWVGIKAKDVLRSSLFVMTPLALAAVGECINEKAGAVSYTHLTLPTNREV